MWPYSIKDLRIKMLPNSNKDFIGVVCVCVKERERVCVCV